MFFLHLIAALDVINGDFFEELFEEHENRVYRMAYGMVNSTEDAKDIVQDTFFKVYLHIDHFKELKREEIISLIIIYTRNTVIIIYTRNTVIDLIRKKQRRIQTISLVYEDDDGKEFDIPAPDRTPEEVLMNKYLGETLAECIDRLSDAQRDVILLKYKYGMNDKEIAAILSIQETAVSSRLNRARKCLRDMLTDLI